MVNEERLRSMIKLAQFDKNYGERCKPMIQYARKDYVSIQLLGSFVTGTMAYVLFAGLLVLNSIEKVLDMISQTELSALLTSVMVSYFLFMFFYMGATYIIFHMKYTIGRRKVKKYYGSLKKVNQMYEREERLKRTAHTDWD